MAGAGDALLRTLTGNLKGAAWLMTAVVGMAVQSALVKWLGQNIESIQIMFLRGAIGLLMVLPLLLRPSVRIYTGNIKLHILRAIAGVLSMFCWFYTLTRLSLAEATSYSFTMPLFLTVLAWGLLKEKPEWRVWCATVIGFCGVLIMMRPTQVTMELATLSGLAAALFHALAAILIKTLSNKESAVHLLLYFPIVAIVILAVPALVRWEDPSLIEWFGLIGVAGLGVQTQWSFIRACRLADMSVIAPFDYSRLLFAAILGYVFFVEIPDYWTIAGALVIVLTTLYVARRGATS